MANAPFIASQKLHSTGSSHGITVPVAWLKNNNIDPKKVTALIVVGNENLIVLNPHGKLARELKDRLTKKDITLERLKEIIDREVVF